MTNPHEQVEAAKSVAGNAAERAGDVASTAKENVAEVKDTALAVGGDVVETTKAEVSQVVDEAKTAAQTLLDEGLTQLRGGAETGQAKLAEVVRAVTDELDEMTRGTSTNGVVTQFASTAQSYGDKAATWLEGKGPDELMTDVRRFAARKPVTFLAIAAGAGFLASRLARGLQGAASDEQQSQQRFAGYGDPRYGDPQYGYDPQTRYAAPAYDGGQQPRYGAQAGYAGGTTEHTTGYAQAGQYGTPGYDQPAATGQTPVFGQVTEPGYDLDGYPVDTQEPRR